MAKKNSNKGETSNTTVDTSVETTAVGTEQNTVQTSPEQAQAAAASAAAAVKAALANIQAVEAAQAEAESGLSDALGQMFQHLRPGQAISLAGKRFTITEKTHERLPKGSKGKVEPKPLPRPVYVMREVGVKDEISLD